MRNRHHKPASNPLPVQSPKYKFASPRMDDEYKRGRAEKEFAAHRTVSSASLQWIHDFCMHHGYWPLTVARSEIMDEDGNAIREFPAERVDTNIQNVRFYYGNCFRMLGSEGTEDLSDK